MKRLTIFGRRRKVSATKTLSLLDRLFAELPPETGEDGAAEPMVKSDADVLKMLDHLFAELPPESGEDGAAEPIAKSDADVLKMLDHVFAELPPESEEDLDRTGNSDVNRMMVQTAQRRTEGARRPRAILRVAAGLAVNCTALAAGILLGIKLPVFDAFRSPRSDEAALVEISREEPSPDQRIRVMTGISLNDVRRDGVLGGPNAIARNLARDIVGDVEREASLFTQRLQRETQLKSTFDVAYNDALDAFVDDVVEYSDSRGDLASTIALVGPSLRKIGDRCSSKSIFALMPARHLGFLNGGQHALILSSSMVDPDGASGLLLSQLMSDGSVKLVDGKVKMDLPVFYALLASAGKEKVRERCSTPFLSRDEIGDHEGPGNLRRWVVSHRSGIVHASSLDTRSREGIEDALWQYGELPTLCR